MTTAASCLPTPSSFTIDEKAWKKALGLFQSKTGVSEKIRAVEAAFTKIDTEKLDARTCLANCANPVQFAEARRAAIEYLDKSIAPLANAVDDLRSHLEETLKEFRSSKLCPKSTLKYAEGLLKKVNEYKQITTKIAFMELEADFKKQTETKLKNFGIAAEKLSNYASIWDDGVKKLKEDLEKADSDNAKLSLYDVFRRHYIRGFGTALPLFRKDPHLSKHLNNWLALSQDSGQPKETSAINKLLKIMDEKYVPELKKDMVKSGIG